MIACLCQKSVQGVGQGVDPEALVGSVTSDFSSDVATDAASSGFWSGLGDFFSNGFGSDLLKAGVTVGTGYAVSTLGGGSKGGTQQVPYTNPLTGQSNAPSPQPTTPAAPVSTTPGWVLPVSIVGGLTVLGLLLMKR